MNAITEGYLKALKVQRERLVERLVEKRVECDGAETFNSLIKKVGTIYDTGGLAYGEWLPISNTDTFSISGLNALPKAFGVSCEGVITNHISEEGSIFIALFSYEPESDEVSFYKYLDDNTFIYDKISKDTVYDTWRGEDGSYGVKISFTELNEMTQRPYLFKGGYEYNWVASSKEWFL